MLGPLSGPACCPVGLVDVCMLIWCRSNGGSWGQTSLYGCHCTMADGRAARWREVRRCGRSCLPQHRVNFNIGHMSVAYRAHILRTYIGRILRRILRHVGRMCEKKIALIISNNRNRVHCTHFTSYTEDGCLQYTQKDLSNNTEFPILEGSYS